MAKKKTFSFAHLIGLGPSASEEEEDKKAKKAKGRRAEEEEERDDDAEDDDCDDDAEDDDRDDGQGRVGHHASPALVPLGLVPDHDVGNQQADQIEVKARHILLQPSIILSEEKAKQMLEGFLRDIKAGKASSTCNQPDWTCRHQTSRAISKTIPVSSSSPPAQPGRTKT